MKKVSFDADLTSIRDFFEDEIDLGFYGVTNKVNLSPLLHRHVRVTIEELPDPKVPISAMPQMAVA